MTDVNNENQGGILDGIIEGILSNKEESDLNNPKNSKNTEEDTKDTPNDNQEDEEIVEALKNSKNAEIRLKKFKNQRNEARLKVSELEKQLAQLQGKLSVLENPKKQEEKVEDTQDITEYMTDSERMLYEENKKLKLEIEEVKKFISDTKKDKKVNELSEREKIFFKNNPELEKNMDTVVEKIETYLKTKPFLIERVTNNEISFDELWALVNISAKDGKTVRKVQDPDHVFSKTNTIPTSIKESKNKQSSSYQASSSRNIVSKEEAINEATEHILDFLRSK